MDDRIEVLTRRIERVERSNRLMKIWGGVAIALMLVTTQVPNILANNPHPVPMSTTNLNPVSGSGQVLATLGAAPGGAALTFFDSAGNKTTSMGMVSNGNGAGIQAFDGNTLAPGTGVVRAGFGVGGASSGAPGFGALVLGPGPSNVFLASFGTGPDTSPLVPSVVIDDTNGVPRAGIDSDAANNFAGFFEHDASGVTRAAIGASLDGNLALTIMNDSTGVTRTGVDVDSGKNFTGFFQHDSAGVTRSVIGGNLTGAYQPSFADLFDSAATLRVENIEFGLDNSEAVAVFDSTGTPQGHLP